MNGLPIPLCYLRGKVLQHRHRSPLMKTFSYIQQFKNKNKTHFILCKPQKYIFNCFHFHIIWHMFHVAKPITYFQLHHPRAHLSIILLLHGQRFLFEQFVIGRLIEAQSSFVNRWGWTHCWTATGYGRWCRTRTERNDQRTDWFAYPNRCTVSLIARTVRL